jgi:segregation and condensation protein A
VADCGTTLEVVARFLALLELYRDGVVAFDQVAALSDLRVRWTETPAALAEPAEQRRAFVDEEYG